MGDNEQTRRRFVTSGAIATGAVLAGCTSGTNSDTPNSSSDADSNADSDSDSSADGSGNSDESYTISIEPMGEVEFDEVPERWMSYFSTYGDMGIALGKFDGCAALVYAENWPDQFYDTLPGVDVDLEDVTQIMSDSGIDKETFYELDCDVHLFDPNFIKQLDDSWTDEDFEEIDATVGPIVGNMIRRRDQEWHDYEYYTLYELFEKIADLFQERERYEALSTVHDEFIERIEADLPPESERPEIGLVSVNSDFEGGSFYAYPITEGNEHKHLQTLGIRDAFASHIDGNYAEWDLERLLEIDPDVLVFSFGFSHASAAEFEERMDLLREDPVGRELTAVQNDRLYRGGTGYQGPLINLIQTEITAKQFYPEVFGEWNGLETLESEDEQLFDHHEVGQIVDGSF